LIRQTMLNALQINSDLPVASEHVKGEAVGMSQVELECLRVTDEKWLSIRVAAKLKLPWFFPQVAGQDLPQ
jgi:hypothetical protein